MVASNIYLPNIRKLFIPDPGYAIVDADLSGADAQVVAWEAEDEELKAAFRAGLKIHLKNARDLYPDETKDMTDKEIKDTDYPTGMYHDLKRSVHATNYGGTPPTIAETLKWPIRRAIEFQERWFYLHPGIKEWHNRTERFLLGLQCWNCNAYPLTNSNRCKNCDAIMGRTVKNAFGYRRPYFDRVEGILPEALAWVPQSTVAINTQRGWDLLDKEFSFIEVLLQVHDSLVFQLPMTYVNELDYIKSRLNTIVTPYSDPLKIPWGVKMSFNSWGDCE